MALNLVQGKQIATASWAINALTASYLDGYTSPFPFTGSAQITGSLGITGSASILSGSLTIDSVAAANTLILSGSTPTITLYSSGSVSSNGRIIVEDRAWGSKPNETDSQDSFLLQLRGSGSIPPVGSIRFRKSSNSRSNILISPGDTDIAIYISGSGNVGIGTTRPTSASLHVNGNVFANSYTGSLFGTASFATSASFAISSSRAVTSSFAISASWAPMRPGGSDTQIQFNSGSTLVGTGSFTFDYIDQSLQQGLAVTASGLYSHAEGDRTKALLPFSHAEGVLTIASGYGSHTEGGSTEAIGNYSHAEGDRTQAIGLYSHAEGAQTQALGLYSHAEGYLTDALGAYSHAEGDSTITGIKTAFGVGKNAIVDGLITLGEDQTTYFTPGGYLYLYDPTTITRPTYLIDTVTFNGLSTLIQLVDTSININNVVFGDITYLLNNGTFGSNGTIPGDFSHAEGLGTQAVGTWSHTEGNLTNALGDYSHAEGFKTLTQGSYSHAEGIQTQAIGSGSHAEGRSTTASADYSHTEGYITKTGITTAFVTTLEEGVNLGLVRIDSTYGNVTAYFTPGNYLYLYDSEFSNIYGYASFLIDTVTWDGIFTYIQLVDTPVTTATAYVGDLTYLKNNGTFGGNKTIPGSWSHAEGFQTQAVGPSTHAEGQQTQASGPYSHTEGYLTQAIGAYSHAEGQNTRAIGNYSHAEGFETIASGSDSHAEGESTQAIGASSHAEGNISKAIGDFSHAEGDNTQAKGNYSHAEGQETISSGSYSHAEGYATISSGQSSHAEGSVTLAQGDYSHAEGASTQATGAASHAEGQNTQATGESAHAEGLSTIASGDYSHAEGEQTVASGSSSHAEGLQTLALGEYSHAEGSSTQATGLYSHAEGFLTISSGTNSHAEGSITQTIGDSSHAEGGGTVARGEYSHAEGISTTASGSYSHAEGNSTLAQGDESHAEGNGTNAIGRFSHAEGGGTVALGQGSHAEGDNTEAIGDYSHAEGNSTIASGSYSHAEGQNTRAIGNFSHAEGDTTTAQGNGSHAEGVATIAVGLNSHAEGLLTSASANYSHAEGQQTQARGEASHAEGLGTVALGSYQHVQGQYNISSSAPSAFIIGNGNSNANRSNLVFASGSTVQVTGSVIATQGFTGSLLGTAATASFAPNYLPLSGGTIAGSLTINNNLTVLGSASIQYISESTLNIGTNLITVNTINPGARFGGLAVIDSGSSPQVSASFLYDSLQDEFVFVHRGTSTSAITSSVFLLGPETYNNLGNETYLTANRIPKGTGIEHLNDSNISDDGSVVSINSNTQVTGSLIVTQGITGSLQGTASFAVTASYAMNGGGGGSGGTDLGLVQAMTVGLQNIF